MKISGTLSPSRIVRDVIWCLVGLWFGLTPATAAADSHDPASSFFNQSFGDLQEDLSIAREEDKHALLIFFEMDECPFCHRMKTQILNQAGVQTYFRNHFRILSMDTEGDLEIIDFQGRQTTQKEFSFNQNKVRATPVFAFFNLQGQSIARYTGATANATEFLWLGEYIVEGIYKTQSFTRYKRQRRKTLRSR